MGFGLGGGCGFSWGSGVGRGWVCVGSWWIEGRVEGVVVGCLVVMLF